MKNNIIHTGEKYTVSTLGADSSNSSKSPKATAVIPDKTVTDKIAKWGVNNNEPEEILASIENVSLIHPILDWKIRALYSKGLAYGFVSSDQNENEIREPIIDEEINNWLRDTNIKQYLADSFASASYFYNIFPEIVFSKDKRRINKLVAHKAKNCRWSIANNRGFSEFLYLSSTWGLGAKFEDDNTSVIPVLDLTQSIKTQIKKNKNGTNYILPVKFPSPGRDYYSRAPWLSLVNTKWLNIASDVPKAKHAILSNLLSVKYIIHVPEWWWESQYENFDSMSKDEQKAIVKKEHINFNNFLSGVDNQGKSLIIHSKDQMKDIKYAEWKIEAVDDKLSEGKYIEDSQEADAHIFKNLQVDPTLFGSGPGKNTQSSGSGSDKRVAWNLYDLLQTSIQEIVLSPLDYISAFNGWEERLLKANNKEGKAELKFWIKSSLITTLDEGETTNI